MLIRRVPANAVPDRVLVPRQKRFTTRRAYFPHAAWLGQGSPHCPIFLTAASRRSLVRVSVPVWGTVLSDPLPIVGTVGRYPAVYLMGRMPVRVRPKPFDPRGCPQKSAWGITRRFHRLSPGRGLVAYALRTRAPLSEAPKDPLPFDLHVLGLPLAFILSQDQTLHCIIVVLYLFPVLGLRYDSLVPYSRNGPASRLTVSDLCWPQAFKELSKLLSFVSYLPRCLGLQKYIKNLYAQAFFEKKFKKKSFFF